MTGSRLIVLEGLPGSGKSTNAALLRMQLERNGYRVKWLHEVARPHPLLPFSEACFTWEEYHAFLKAHPEAEGIISHVAAFYRRTVGIDMLEVQWHYLNAIGEKAYRALEGYDALFADVGKCGAYIEDKWALFSQRAQQDGDCVYILDSCLFQFHIWGLLLENTPYEYIEQYISRLVALVKPLDPALIYLYRADAEHSISFLEKERGLQGLEGIAERDGKCPYYRDKPKGAEGFKQFLRDYASIAEKLFAAIDCTKIDIDMSAENWAQHEDRMLSFLKLQRQPYLEATPPSGTYRNDALGLSMRIDGTVMRDPEGVVRTLTPKSANEFYVERIPTVLRIDEGKRLVVSAGQIAARWTTLGAAYYPD